MANVRDIGANTAMKLDPVLLMGLLDVSFDEIYVTDANGMTLWVNKACERFYGLPAEQLIGRSVRDLERQGVFSPSLTLRALKEGRKVTAVQSTHHGRKLLVTSNPVHDAEGHLAYVISNSRDITELLSLADRLNDAEALLDHYAVENHRLRAAVHDRSDEFIFTSPVMQEVMTTVVQVARVDTTVLISGETGVGKTAVARRIHEMSLRHKGRFVDLNCAAIPDTLLESELFGYDKGAFTGARKEGKTGMVGLAEGGTLFLDEVSELPLHLQSKLLQLIQERRYYQVGGTRALTANIRIIAATNRDLQQMVDEKSFRKDLYYRLHVVPIHIPPLRQRPEDIDLLINHYLAAVNNRYGMNTTVAPETRQSLRAYDWPGNIRELENVLERLVITASHADIQPTDLPLEMHSSYDAGVAPPIHQPQMIPGPTLPTGFQPIDLSAYLDRVEREILELARRQHGSTHKLARVLGISQTSVVRKLKKHRLSP